MATKFGELASRHIGTVIDFGSDVMKPHWRVVGTLVEVIHFVNGSDRETKVTVALVENETVEFVRPSDNEFFYG